jgi:TolA-binding protein
MRDYVSARDTLRRSYENFTAGRLAADSLYFLGRALTNTGEDEEAINIYLKLLESFPASNLADDTLYRIGRIYFSRQDMETAMQYFQTAVDKYPESDIISDIYWELGWMQYSLGRYNESLNTFDLMSQRFRGGQLEEVSLFWKAKSMQKAGMANESVEAYQRIAGVNPYSYYGFRSIEILNSLGISTDFPSFDQELSPLNPDIREVIPDIYDLVSYFEISLPKPVTGTIDILSSLAIPLALISIGASFRFHHIRSNIKLLTPVVILKLILMPVIAFVISFYVFNLDKLDTSIVAVLFSMPLAAAAYIMSSALIISTIFSSLSITIWLTVLKMI